jgi:hypothetical protein
MKKVKVLLVGATCALLAACQTSQHYVAGPTASGQDEESVKAQCRIEASRSQAGPGWFFPIAEAIYKSAEADDCVLARGWRHSI